MIIVISVCSLVFCVAAVLILCCVYRRRKENNANNTNVTKLQLGTLVNKMSNDNINPNTNPLDNIDSQPTFSNEQQQVFKIAASLHDQQHITPMSPSESNSMFSSHQTPMGPCDDNNGIVFKALPKQPKITNVTTTGNDTETTGGVIENEQDGLPDIPNTNDFMNENVGSDMTSLNPKNNIEGKSFLSSDVLGWNNNDVLLRNPTSIRVRTCRN